MSLKKIKILVSCFILIQCGRVCADEQPVDHSSLNYDETNTLPTTEKFPVDIYCPEVIETLPWSFYTGISYPFYKSPLSQYVDTDVMAYILGMTKDFADFNHGYTTFYSLLETRTYNSDSSFQGIDYRFTRTNFNIGLGIEQGLWTRYFLTYLNVKPGLYQSSFRSSDNLIHDDSYQIFLELDSGFKIYFSRKDDFIFYSNLNVSIDVTRRNNVTFSDVSNVNSNQVILYPGIEFGLGF